MERVKVYRWGGSFGRFICLCLMGISLQAWGADEVCYFHQLNRSQGLSSQDHNLYVFQDSRGFVWISSLTGLNRYSGNRNKVYLHQEGDSTSLYDNNVHSRFFEDKRGDLWFSTNGALHRYLRSQDHFQRYFLPFDSTVRGVEYQLLYLDSEKEILWLRNKTALYRLPLDNPRAARRIGEAPFSVRTTIARNRWSGELMLHVPGAGKVEIFSLENEKMISRHTLELPGKVQPRFFHWEKDETIWVGSRSGLFRFKADGSGKRVRTSYEGDTLYDFTDILPISSTRFLLSTYKSGIFFFNPQTQQIEGRIYSNERDRLVSFPYQADRLHMGKDSSLWVSSRASGVFFTHPSRRIFSLHMPVPENKADDRNFIRAMTETPSGQLICLSRNGLFSVDPARTLTCEPWGSSQPLPFGNENVYSMVFDPQAGYWVCTQSGIYLRELGQSNFCPVSVSPPPKNPHFLYIMRLQDGRILAYSKGIYEIRKQQGDWRAYLLPGISETSQTYGYAIQSSDGRVFATTYQTSIQEFQPQGGTEGLSLVTKIPFKHWVTGMACGPSDTLWVASHNGLYFRPPDGKGDSLYPVPSFQSIALSGMLQDEAGHLWLSSIQGLCRYEPDLKRITWYQMSHGLQDLEFNYWAAYQAESGHMVFGGVNGLNTFQPDRIRAHQVAFSPAIVDIYLHNKPLPRRFTCRRTGARSATEIQELEFQNTDNTLSFFCSGLDYENPLHPRILISLSDEDGDTLNKSRTAQVTYPNLSPGSYRISLSSAHPESEGTAAQVLLFRILPHWSATWWFRTLVFAAIFLVSFLIYRNRLDKARKLRQIAEYKQLVAEAETAILRMQMNPHFIFNSLNAIRSYMFDKDIDTADEYLVQMASLMRKILNVAPKAFIDLQKETDLLREYLEVEAQRFERSFTYQIEVGDALEPEEVFVPTMLLQPFVENAIIHGLLMKNGEGQITIQFWKQQEQLFCSVKDNGIGRAASSQREQQHESKAMEITRKRLELLEEQYQQNTELYTLDLIGPENQALGTQVVVILPLL